MKYSAFICCCILLLISSTASAVVIGDNSEEVEGVIIGGIAEGGGNTSWNQTFGDANYWRLDGTNAPPSADWDMGGYGFSDVSNTTFSGSRYTYTHQGDVNFYAELLGTGSMRYAYWNADSPAYNFLVNLVMPSSKSLTIGSLHLNDDSLVRDTGELSIKTLDPKKDGTVIQNKLTINENTDSGKGRITMDLDAFTQNITTEGNITASGVICDSVGCIGDATSFNSTNIAYLNNSQVFNGTNEFQQGLIVNKDGLTSLPIGGLINVDAGDFIGDTARPILDIQGDNYGTFVGILMNFVLQEYGTGTGYIMRGKVLQENFTHALTDIGYFIQMSPPSNNAGGNKILRGFQATLQPSNLLSATEADVEMTGSMVESQGLIGIPSAEVDFKYNNTAYLAKIGPTNIWDINGGNWSGPISQYGFECKGYGTAATTPGLVGELDRACIYSDGGDAIFNNGNLEVGGNTTVNDRLFWSAYASTTTDATSIASAAMRNPFDSDSYVTYTYDNNTIPNLVDYDTSTGEFMINKDGVFKIDFDGLIQIASSDEINITVFNNGVGIYDHDVFINSAVGPVYTGITLLADIDSGDMIEVYIGALDGVDAVTFHSGTTITITQVS